MMSKVVNILYDFRSYQLFSKRGVGRYVYEVFNRCIMSNAVPCYALVDKSRSLPDLKKAHRYVTFVEVSDFKEKNDFELEFDFFLVGSSIVLGLDGYLGVEACYPPLVLRHCRYRVAICHDFIPLLFQEYIPDERAKVNFTLQMEMMNYLDHIFTNSEFTLYSCLRYLKQPKENLTCIYGGADEKRFLTANSQEPYQRKQRGDHLVCISGDAPQKNVDGLVEAFSSVYSKGKIPKTASLYIICHASDHFKNRLKNLSELYDLKFGKQIIVTGYISDREMLKRLENCKGTIFPSFYEGLGLPILESYVAGAPAWASNTSATIEFVKPECSFDPFDPESIQQAIVDLYYNDKLCEASLEFGRDLVKRINWDFSANTILKTMDKMVQKSLEKENKHG